MYKAHIEYFTNEEGTPCAVVKIISADDGKNCKVASNGSDNISFSHKTWHAVIEAVDKEINCIRERIFSRRNNYKDQPCDSIIEL